MHLLRVASLSSLLAVAAWAAEASSALPKSSPFVPTGAAAGPAESSAERIEFTGVSTIGEKTEFIFLDKTAKKNHWVTKGETKEGISVVNYDAQREQVVVKLNGAEKTLSLRRNNRNGGPRPVMPMPTGFNIAPGSTPAVASANLNTVSAGQPPTPTTNAAPAAPATPETAQQKQETEARMLVSDLLEIGMAQRKAYEEAQRKAAGANPDGAAAPAVPNAAPNPTRPDGR